MDTRPGTIVVGVDGSPASADALDWAVDEAVAQHRALTLVHAISATTFGMTDAVAVDPVGFRDALSAAGHEILAAARADVELRAPELEVHEVFHLEDPRQVLVELSHTAAQLVVGSRGRGPVPSLLLGSVGMAVVRHAHCPVVVHRPGGQGQERNGIVVGADGTENSRVVLEFAYSQAAFRDLPLTVLQCSWDGGAADIGGYPSPAVDLESERLLLAESMAGMAEKYPDVTVHSTLSRGLPQDSLVRIGERMNLIVVGSHHSGRLTQLLFGSVWAAVVEHATTPVAVVPLTGVV